MMDHLVSVHAVTIFESEYFSQGDADGESHHGQGHGVRDQVGQDTEVRKRRRLKSGKGKSHVSVCVCVGGEVAEMAGRGLTLKGFLLRHPPGSSQPEPWRTRPPSRPSPANLHVSVSLHTHLHTQTHTCVHLRREASCKRTTLPR